MSTSTDYRQQIINAANRHGVPPEIALAVAVQESNTRQFNPDGSVVSRYEPRLKQSSWGIFQLLESTARDLGVDPKDPAQNIDGGVRYLKKVYGWVGTGNWEDALQAYNGGIGNWQRGDTSTHAKNYAKAVLARSGYQSGPTQQPGQIQYAGLEPWLGPSGYAYATPGAGDGGAVYGSDALFTADVFGAGGGSTALWLVLGLAAALAIQQAV